MPFRIRTRIKGFYFLLLVKFPKSRKDFAQIGINLDRILPFLSTSEFLDQAIFGTSVSEFAVFGRCS